MDKDSTPFNSDELSPDDLEILRAFDAWENQAIESPASDAAIQEKPSADSEPEKQAPLPTPDEMLMLFVSEVDADLAIILQTLLQLEPDNLKQGDSVDADAARLLTVQRLAHKLKGTTGTMGCTIMATIAYYIEALAQHITQGTLVPFLGVNALIQAALALETTLSSFVTTGKESGVPLTQLETEYTALGISLSASKRVFPVQQKKSIPTRVFLQPIEDEEVAPTPRVSQTTQELSPSTPLMHIDARRFEQLVRHTEQLAELHVPLESAQAQVETALQELHIAQARLWRLETLFSTHPFSSQTSNGLSTEQDGSDEHPTSSLVARILDEAAPRTGHLYQRKSKISVSMQKAGTTPLWDEMEIDRYTESGLLAQWLNEAIADVTTASARLRAAFAQLHSMMQNHTDQAANVRNDTLLLLPHSQRVVQGLLVRVGKQRVMVPFAQVQRIDYGQKKLPEPPYVLNMLLGFPEEQTAPTTVQPLLVLQSGPTHLLVQVDEVLGEVELVVKPLASYLQRPGILGTAIDGMGNVLLIVDLPKLIQCFSKTGIVSQHKNGSSIKEEVLRTILIADDSVYIRQSLLLTLSRAGYRVIEAHDGTEALEQLLDKPPDVLVLDMEMPNLNGYDLLNILRAHPELDAVKIVMLTSRSSEKHQKRAYELGVHSYLTKPCPQDILLETIRSLFAQE